MTPSPGGPARQGKPCVLMVFPEAFQLGWMGSTQRVHQVARALESLGYDVALLARRSTNPRVQADIDKAFPGPVFRTPSAGAYPRAIGWSAILRRLWHVGWKLQGEDVYHSRFSWGWAATLDLPRVLAMLAERKPAVLWAISTGYLAGPLAAERIAAALGVPWIMELQDPPRGAGLGADVPAVRATFQALLRSARRTVVVTESYRDELCRTFDIGTESVDAIHLGFDGDIAEPRSDPHASWRLVYAGSLNEGRTAVPVIRAWSRALRQAPTMRETAGFELVGAGTGFDDAAAVTRELGLGDVVRFRGYQSKAAADQALEQADALTVFQSPATSRLQVPGKLFAVLQRGKPVLGVMPDCEAATILRRSGLGVVHDESDIAGIADTLVRLWGTWRAGEVGQTPDRAYVARFSTRTLPEKMAQVLDFARITGRAPAGGTSRK